LVGYGLLVSFSGLWWRCLVHGHKHVSDLQQLSFFVLDEADRMVQQVRECLSVLCILCAS
jgi:hypothetical protein